jgi:hypothetical protein
VAAGSISMPIRLPWPNASGHENRSPRDSGIRERAVTRPCYADWRPAG